MAQPSFHFIVSDGPKVPQDRVVRTLIRKQAMKDVGIARKQKKKKNCRTAKEVVTRETDGLCCPGLALSEFDDIDDLVPISSPTGYQLQKWANDQAKISSALASLSLNSAYEKTRMKFCIDLTDLNILTNFNVNSSAIKVLGEDPSRLSALLGHRAWSYLEYVPARYGFSKCLTAATDCLLAKAHAVLAPQTKAVCYATCNRLYGVALRSLQDALIDDKACLEADVLCATQLLSLHELLDSARDSAWSHHVHGSAKLVKYRSPARFQTEFEKALFASHVGGIVSEALLQNTHCYLEQPEWVQLFSSISQDTTFLTDRSPLTLKARTYMIKTPGVWHDVGEVVNSHQLFNDTSIALVKRCRKLHQEMSGWMEDYKAHCVRLALFQPPSMELDLRRELYGTVLECLSIAKRLLATVCDNERFEIEAETQAVAQLLMDLQEQPSPKHSWLFADKEVGVAYTILLTKDHWEEDLHDLDERSQKLAIRTRFNTWCYMLRAG